MLMRLQQTSKNERGAVMIVVAVALPVIAIMVSLAINVAHWYDYSRNLQLRADASALAAGDSYGAICANPTQNAMDVIGKTAQLYAGPMSAASDVYYPYATTPTDLAALGQTTNPAAGSNGYFNLPQLKAGTAAHYHVILNSNRYWHTGDTSQSLSFNMGSVCNATDGTDTGPMVDVRVTQDNLPLFMPFFGLNSTLNAHARVEAQGIGISNNLKPLGVRDPGATPCLTVTFTPTVAGQGSVKSFELTLDQALSTGASQVWDNGNGTNVTMPPAGSNYVVSVTEHTQGADNTCNTSANPITYDKLLIVNSYGTVPAVDTVGYLDPTSDGTTHNWTKSSGGTGPNGWSLVNDGVRQPTVPSAAQIATNITSNPANNTTFSVAEDLAFANPGGLTVKAGDTYTVYAYGHAGRNRNIQVETSTDGGTTWSAPSTLLTGLNGSVPASAWGNADITASVTSLNNLQLRLIYTNTATNNSTGQGEIDTIYVQRTPATPNNAPKLVGDANGGGATLITNNACVPDQYFSTGAGCGVFVCAVVAFSADATNPGLKVNGTAMAPSANPLCATAVAGASAWISPVINIAQLSGVHTMDLVATETSASHCGLNGGGNPKTCSDDLGVQQQAYGACNGDSGTVLCPADNSGPVVRAEIGEGLNGTIGSFQGGSTHLLEVRIDLQGLSDAAPTDRCPNQCTLMRFGVGNTNGSVDCGTGNSTSSVRQAMLDGCPKFGTAACANQPYCAPYTKSVDGTCNNLNGRTTAFPVDCINSNNNGSTIPECIGALVQTGGTQVGGGDPCDFNGSTGCAVNHWTQGDPIVSGDPRIITTFIVYPGDISGATGNTPIPIRLFASFYVTGWQDQGNGKTISCPKNGPQANEPAPPGATKASIWGHWITYTEPDAGGNGKPCNFQAFGDCAVVLTR